MNKRSDILATLLLGWAFGALLVTKLSLLGLVWAAVFIVVAMHVFGLRHHPQFRQTPLVARSFYYLWFLIVILLPQLVVVLLAIFCRVQHHLKKRRREVTVPWSRHD